MQPDRPRVQPDSYPIFGYSRMAFDAAPRRARDSDPADPISAVLQFANEFIPEDQRQPFADLVEALVKHCGESPATDRRASRPAMDSASFARLHRDAASRRQAATDAELDGMFPTLGRIGQAWGRCARP